MPSKKRSTLLRRSEASVESDSAVDSTSAALRPVDCAPLETWMIVSEIVSVPMETSFTFLEISLVARLCCSTDTEMSFEISDISAMTLAMSLIASAAWLETVCIAWIWVAISSVAWAVWVASDFTSEATTAKPLPASPGPGRLDGRVQRKQVGLRGDVVDQADDLADPVGGGHQALNGLIGLGGCVRSLVRDGCLVFHAAGDFGNRGGQFLGRGGDGTHVGGGVAGGAGGSFRVRGALVGSVGKFARCTFQFVGCIGDRFQNAVDLLVETAQKAIDGSGAALLGFLVGLALSFQLALRLAIGLEDLHGVGDRADFVIALQAVNGGIEIAFGNLRHGPCHGGQRPREQGLEQGAENGQHEHGGNHRCDDRGIAEAGQAGIGSGLVDRQTNLPVHGEARDRRQIERYDRHWHSMHIEVDSRPITETELSGNSSFERF